MEFSIVTFVVKLSLTILLSSFMVLTAVSFFKVRLVKKEKQFKNILSALAIPEDNARIFVPLIQDEYAPQDYWFPVIFSSFTCVMGFGAILFGGEVVSINPGKLNVLLTGPIFQGLEDNQETIELLQRHRWRIVVASGFGFLGAFVWSAQNIVRRLIAGDLFPSTYYATGLRMIYATSVAIILTYLLEALPSGDYSKEMIPVVSFLAGVMPEHAFLYVRDKVMMFSASRRTQAAALPLSMIEGITLFHKVRLSEIGVDNAQNLASANLVELLLKTPYNPSQLIDWIAQAHLYIYFKEQIITLRKFGIRTIFEFLTVCSAEEKLVALAQETGISQTRLAVAWEQLQGDTGARKLMEFHAVLGGFGEN